MIRILRHDTKSIIYRRKKKHWASSKFKNSSMLKTITKGLKDRHRLKKKTTKNHLRGASQDTVLNKTSQSQRQIQLALYIPGRLHICGSNQQGTENIQGKKIPESSKKQNLNLLHTRYDLHSNDTVCIVSNPEMHRLHANNVPFDIRGLSFYGFWHLQWYGLWKQCPRDIEGVIVPQDSI